MFFRLKMLGAVKLLMAQSHRSDHLPIALRGGRWRCLLFDPHPPPLTDIPERLPRHNSIRMHATTRLVNQRREGFQPTRTVGDGCVEMEQPPVRLQGPLNDATKRSEDPR